MLHRGPEAVGSFAGREFRHEVAHEASSALIRHLQAEGFDPDWLITQYAKMMHDAIENRPDDMIIAMHLCRGNFKSTWVAEGAYDPAADAVFNQTGVDVYFMEYDSERAGGIRRC